MQLNIAILGTRGIPNHYGGFEYVAARLGEILVQKGHRVTVYNSHRHPYKEKQWNGISIIHRFDPEYFAGTFGQFIYDLNCIRDTRRKKYDIILVLGYTSSSVWSFLYPKRSVIITNMDGLEWKRSKYNTLTKKFLLYAEELAVRDRGFCIADSRAIKKYLDDKYMISSRYIAYGADTGNYADEKLLETFGLQKENYFLLMARQEPENNIEMILDGYSMSGSDRKFIVIGNAENAFGKKMQGKFRPNRNIVFAGPVFDENKVRALTSCCSLYFHGHSVGGTNPSLLAAMAAKAPIAVHDNEFNRAVTAENASYFSNAKDVSDIIAEGDFKKEDRINNNYEVILHEYSWERIASQYEDYFIECYKNSAGKK